MWPRITISAAISLTVAIAAIVPAAATATSGEIILTANGSTTVSYGDATPSFRAVLTLPSGDPPPTDMTFYFLVDSQLFIGSVSWTNPTWQLFTNGLGAAPFSVGQHTVVAQYKSPNQVLTSAPVTLNVLKKTPGLDCSIMNVTNTYAVNAALTIRVQFANTNAPVDIQHGTFSISFSGPRIFTSANLTANSAGEIFGSAPPATGVYRVSCSFSGTASFNPVATQMNVPSMVVSANNQPGRIALYTSPTPVTSGASITWEVIVSARAGLPTPTGNIALLIGRSYTKLIALGPDGSVTFQAVAPSLGSQEVINVWYYGDPVYAASSANFPMSTPPIPGTTIANPGTTLGNAPETPAVSTATPDATENPTPPAVSIALPSPSNRVGAALVSRSGQSVPDGRRGLLLVGAIALLTLVGVGAALTWRQRH